MRAVGSDGGGSIKSIEALLNTTKNKAVYETLFELEMKFLRNTIRRFPEESLLRNVYPDAYTIRQLKEQNRTPISMRFLR